MEASPSEACLRRGPGISRALRRRAGDAERASILQPLKKRLARNGPINYPNPSHSQGSSKAEIFFIAGLPFASRGLLLALILRLPPNDFAAGLVTRLILRICFYQSLF